MRASEQRSGGRRERAGGLARQIIETGRAKLDELQRDAARRVEVATRKATAEPVKSRVASAVTGAVGYTAGLRRGVDRGRVRAAEDVIEAAISGARLLNPFDPDGTRAAWEELGDGARAAGGRLADYAATRARDPSRIGDDLREISERYIPTAMTPAGTSGDNFRKNFEVGANSSELALNMAAMALGGGGLKAATTGANAVRAERIASSAGELYGPRAYDYMMQPYDKPHLKAHHTGVKQRTAKKFEEATGLSIPKAFLDGPFNVVRPPGMTYGEFLRLHSKLDDRYHGGGFGKTFGGGGWSADALGWKPRYALPERIWHGTTPATAGAASGAVAGAHTIVSADGKEHPGRLSGRHEPRRSR